MTPINSSLLRLVCFIYSLVLGVFLLPPGGGVSVWKSLHSTCGKEGEWRGKD